MLNIGPQELLLILVVALLVVGPRRLPELARSLGKGIRELRKAQDEVGRTIRVNLDEPAPAATPERKLPETPGPPEAPEVPAPSREAGDASPVHPTADESEVAEISKTLGRGLAELRRAREEIQQSFRVDLEDRPAAKRPPRGRTPSGEERPQGPAE